MIKTLGVVHFTIPVTDLERSAKFYNELLGMRILCKTPRMVFLKCGDDYLILGKSKTPIHSNAEGDTTIHHVFKVAGEDYDPSLEFLRQNGVAILLVDDLQDGVFQGMMAYFHDPDDNTLEIHDSRKIDVE
jgi:catechol 2,3-dioxygenase-like lactoylglutathione lyase family enzyme